MAGERSASFKLPVSESAEGWPATQTFRCQGPEKGPPNDAAAGPVAAQTRADRLAWSIRASLRTYTRGRLSPWPNPIQPGSSRRLHLAETRRTAGNSTGPTTATSCSLGLSPPGGLSITNQHDVSGMWWLI
jgi:hypothetical protein